MRKLYVSIGFLAGTTALACSFQVGTSSKPQTPQASNPPAATTTVAPTTTTPAAVPTPTLPPNAKVIKLSRKPGGGTTAPAGTGTTPTSTGPETVMTGTNVFGNGTADANGFAGSLYAIPAGSTKLPSLDALTPIGTLFAATLNTPSSAMSGGFPGINASLNENFAIRWQAPLVVENEGVYTLRIASDDGAIVKIDGMTIVDNDGNHALQEKSGPVNLVKGTHLLTVDYFQTTGNVALQLFCKHGDQAEIVCPTRL